MKKKYLPIGSVCTLKGMNKKIMINGFFSINYNGNVTLFDYSGCDYPEGLLRNKIYSFNHRDIEKIDYVGYVTEEHSVLNSKMLEENDSSNFENSNVNTKNILMNFSFDENGVVIFEQKIEESKTDVDIKESDVGIDLNTSKNSFIQTQNNQPSSIVENADDFKNWSIFKNIKFDENGTVVEFEEYTADELENMKNKNSDNFEK